MNGSKNSMLLFMEGSNNRYIIPVYQRKYEWKNENCRQLYEDLQKIVREGRSSHFFGSIVSAVVPNGSKIEYHIIDGQQRLTTVTLLLLAMRNLIRQGKLKAKAARLDEQMNQRFLIDPWALAEESQIKLRPVKGDREALRRLFEEPDEAEFDRASNLTLNYRFFCDMLMRMEASGKMTADELYAALGKLEIINITLDSGDNAQLIFESLNSTGMALYESDKIRNYILMSLPPKEQNRYYDAYWAKIEQCAKEDLSGFIRDYLSVKQRLTPTIGEVYRAFKRYTQGAGMTTEALLEDILRYAKLFERLQTCQSGLDEPKLDACLYRLKRLEIVVTRPFMLEVLRLNQEGKLTVGDVLSVFLMTENYLFRRNICEVPTNALNKVFLNLNYEILRYDGTTARYAEKCAYTLLNKRESGRFPDDEEFSAALGAKQVYQMRGRYKAYLFERLENYGTVETKDVFAHLDNNDYSIEHIMPQTLTPQWRRALGGRADEIHAAWLHRLANLTLTGYNPELSNKSFREKRDTEKGGYKASGLRMNQKIACEDAWGESQMQRRSDELVHLARKIWAYPRTAFEPEKKLLESCALGENIDALTGREIAKYSYQNAEQPVSSWADMYGHVIRMLHETDRSILTQMAFDDAADASFVSSKAETWHNALKVDEQVYVEKNTSTFTKLSILRKIFARFGADPMDLVFYLKGAEPEKKTQAVCYETRRRYWTYALPVIQAGNAASGNFSKNSPHTSNAQSTYFGIGGFELCCVANYDSAYVSFYLGSSNLIKNKLAFDSLYRRKAEIEKALGTELVWKPNESGPSRVMVELRDVSVGNEADWPMMAKFHAEWSVKMRDAILPILKKIQF